MRRICQTGRARIGNPNVVRRQSPDRQILSGGILDHGCRLSARSRQTYAPAAVLVRDGVDAELEQRDARRRAQHPDAPTDASLLRAHWIDRCSIREIAKGLGGTRRP